MDHLTKALKANGPNASIIFTACIFVGFVQQRYDGAVTRYRDAVVDCRSGEHENERVGNLKGQLLVSRYRCGLMVWATLIGLVASILLIGAVDAITPDVPFIIIGGTIAAIGEFVLAIVVIVEELVVRQQIDHELRDVPDLPAEAGQGETPEIIVGQAGATHIRRRQAGTISLAALQGSGGTAGAL